MLQCGISMIAGGSSKQQIGGVHHTLSPPFWMIRSICQVNFVACKPPMTYKFMLHRFDGNDK